MMLFKLVIYPYVFIFVNSIGGTNNCRSATIQQQGMLCNFRVAMLSYVKRQKMPEGLHTEVPEATGYLSQTKILHLSWKLCGSNDEYMSGGQNLMCNLGTQRFLWMVPCFNRAD